MRSLMALVGGVILTVIMAAPAAAHPRVPDQSVCVINANAVNGGHTAASKVKGVAAHVLWVKSPHFCQ